MDAAHDMADAEIAAFARKVRRVYGDAAEEMRVKLERYLERFAEQDAQKAQAVRDGGLSADAYASWRRGKMLSGRRYKAMLDDLAATATGANRSAMALLRGILPSVFRENANFAAWQVECGSGVPQNMYDADTVRELVNGREAFPRPSVNARKDMAWNRRQLHAKLLQGILMGKSNRDIAGGLREVADMCMAAAMRSARTATTSAENMGRIEGYRRARGMGIDVRQRWMATLDSRTRSSHAALDGEVRPVGERFSNGCRYPGDPDCAGTEIYNCRCTVTAWFPDMDIDSVRTNGTGMDYGEWKAFHEQKVKEKL